MTDLRVIAHGGDLIRAAMVIAFAVTSAQPQRALAQVGGESAFVALVDPAGGQLGSLALGISPDGQFVVGLARGSAGEHAFQWRDNIMTDLGRGPGGPAGCTPHACSADGSVIVGNATVIKPDRGNSPQQRTVASLWINGAVATLTGLPDDLSFSDAWDVSADGSVVVGQMRRDQPNEVNRAFIWRNGQVSELPALADGAVPVAAYAVSADGTTVAGDAEGPDGLEGFRWSQGEPGGLGALSSGLGATTARGISADGRIVVGQSTSPWGDEAFRWENGTMTGLGGLSDDHEFFSIASAASADGSIIVGFSQSSDGGPAAFIWDQLHGMRRLQDVLVHELGLDLSGWTLIEATGISGDGSTIIGAGRNPLGQETGWLARLGAPTRPPAESKIGPDDAAFGLWSATIDSLAGPGGVCISQDRTIIIADTDQNCVRVFNREGHEQRRWTRAVGDGSSLSAPQGVASSPPPPPDADAPPDGGTIFVADSGHDRVVAYAAAGEPIRSWGRTGHGAGELHRPRGVAVQGSRLYVADTGNDRIVVFDLHSDTSQSWGRLGDLPGEFRTPGGVAVDGDGNLYVADTGNNRIQKLDSTGAVVAVFGERGRAPGMFSEPMGVAVTRKQVYVADTGNHRIQVFDLDGGLEYVWGIRVLKPHEAGGRLHFPSALAIATGEEFAAICECREDRCQLFQALERRPGCATAVPYVPPPTAPDYFGAAMDIDGHIMAVAKPQRGGVDLLDISTMPAQLIATVGEYGSRPDQMRSPTGVKLDLRSSQLIVADAGKHSLQFFELDPDIDRWPRPMPISSGRRARLSVAIDLTAIRHNLPPDQLRATIIPGRIERDPLGNIYVLDQGNSGVLVFDARLTLVRMIGQDMGSEDMLRDPVDMALRADGRLLYVVDRALGGVRGYDPAGKLVCTWLANAAGAAGGRDWSGLGGIAVDPGGFVYVTDDSRGVYKLDERGMVVVRWGQKGIGPGEFFKPRAVAVDDSSRVVVLDWGNHRAQMFSADGRFVGAFGAPMYLKPATVASAPK